MIRLLFKKCRLSGYIKIATGGRDHVRGGDGLFGVGPRSGRQEGEINSESSH